MKYKIKYLIFLILILLSNNLFSQILFDSNKFEVKTFYKDNQVIIKNDTVYLMNIQTFAIYQDCYTKIKNNDCYKLLIKTQDVCENRITELNDEYDLLNEQYKILMNESNNLVDDNIKKIEKIDDSLLKLNENLKIINKKNNTNSFIYGGIGLLGGIIIGLII